MRGRSVCPRKDSSISPSTSVTSSSASWTKFAQTCPGGSVHTVQLNPRSAHTCGICDGSMVFSSQDIRNTSFADSVPDATRMLHPVCHMGRSSLLTYGTYNGRIGPSLIFLFRHCNV